MSAPKPFTCPVWRCFRTWHALEQHLTATGHTTDPKTAKAVRQAWSQSLAEKQARLRTRRVETEARAP